jgi:hypothetical protein
VIPSERAHKLTCSASATYKLSRAEAQSYHRESSILRVHHRVLIRLCRSDRKFSNPHYSECLSMQTLTDGFAPPDGLLRRPFHAGSTTLDKHVKCPLPFLLTANHSHMSLLRGLRIVQCKPDLCGHQTWFTCSGQFEVPTTFRWFQRRTSEDGDVDAHEAASQPMQSPILACMNLVARQGTLPQ